MAQTDAERAASYRARREDEASRAAVTRRALADAFGRSVYARVQAVAHSSVGKRYSPAEFIPSTDKLTPAIIAKADQTVGTTTTSGWASQLTQDAWGAYLTELKPYSGAARLIETAVQATASTWDEIYFPVRAAGAVTAGFVAEGAPIPVRSDTFSLVSLGPLRKMASIVGWSRELGRRGDSEEIFRLMLAEDVAASIDSAFFSTAAADTTRPAGLLNGLVPLAAMPGADETAALADLGALAEAVGASGSGALTYIVNPAKLAKLKVLAPTLSLDIVASAAVPATRVIAAEGGSLLIAIDPQPEVLISNVGLLHMSDTPLEIASTAPVTADPVRGLWQTATLAARLIFELSFAKRRAGAVAFIDAASW